MQTNFMKLVLPNTKIKPRQFKTRKQTKSYRPIYFMKIDGKILNKILVNKYQEHIKIFLYSKWYSGVYSKDAKLVHIWKSSKANAPY